MATPNDVAFFAASARYIILKPGRLAYNSTHLCMPSAVIAQYSYDPEKMLLTVSFVSGLVYQYLDVPVEIFEKMRASFSKGIFLNRYIKPNYKFVKVNRPL